MVLSELIKEYKEMCLEDVPVEEVLEDLQKLEDIYKPKDVPQFVVDWYEKYKGNLEYNIWDWMKYTDESEKLENIKFTKWLGDFENNPVETLVKMKLYGYMVKEDKKYTVKIKSVNQYLVRNTDEDFLGFLQSRLKSKFTRKELEDVGLEEVFNNPLFEVEEVE